jgi:hypothetical protein
MTSPNLLTQTQAALGGQKRAIALVPNERLHQATFCLNARAIVIACDRARARFSVSR